MDAEKRIARAEPSSATDKTTRVLLMCGAVAGPLYIIIAFSTQAFIIIGFWIGVVLAWTWLSALMAFRLMALPSGRERAPYPV